MCSVTIWQDIWQCLKEKCIADCRYLSAIQIAPLDYANLHTAVIILIVATSCKTKYPSRYKLAFMSVTVAARLLF